MKTLCSTIFYTCCILSCFSNIQNHQRNEDFSWKLFIRKIGGFNDLHIKWYTAILSLGLKYCITIRAGVFVPCLIVCLSCFFFLSLSFCGWFDICVYHVFAYEPLPTHQCLGSTLNASVCVHECLENLFPVQGSLCHSSVTCSSESEVSLLTWNALCGCSGKSPVPLVAPNAPAQRGVCDLSSLS